MGFFGGGQDRSNMDHGVELEDNVRRAIRNGGGTVMVPRDIPGRLINLIITRYARGDVSIKHNSWGGNLEIKVSKKKR